MKDPPPAKAKGGRPRVESPGVPVATVPLTPAASDDCQALYAPVLEAQGFTCAP